jgi:hypothetical protein
LKKVILFTAVLLVSVPLVAACIRGAATITTPPTTITTTPSTTISPFIWSPEADCAVCHATEVKSMTDTTLLASKHAAAGKACLDCHDAADLQTAHKNVNATPPVPVQKFPRAFCFKCHGSYAAMIELTKGRTRLNPHDSHYGELGCFICHRVHTAKSPDELCVSCHGTLN